MKLTLITSVNEHNSQSLTRIHVKLKCSCNTYAENLPGDSLAVKVHLFRDGSKTSVKVNAKFPFVQHHLHMIVECCCQLITCIID